MKRMLIVTAEMLFRIMTCAVVVVFVLPLNALSWDREGGPAGAGGLGKIPPTPYERPDPYYGHNVGNVRGNEEFAPAVQAEPPVGASGLEPAPALTHEPFGPDDLSGR